MWRWWQGFTSLVCLSSLVSLFFTSLAFSSSSKSLFPYFIDPSTLTVCTRDVWNQKFIYLYYELLMNRWIACPSYFIVHTVRTRDVQNHDKTWMACQPYFIVLTVRTRDVRNHDKTWMACQPYFIVHTVCTRDIQNHDKTWMACQLYSIVLTVRTRDVRNHDKTWMACQPYSIVLTVRTRNVRNHDRLQPVWGSLRLAPIISNYLDLQIIYFNFPEILKLKYRVANSGQNTSSYAGPSSAWHDSIGSYCNLFQAVPCCTQVRR